MKTCLICFSSILLFALMLVLPADTLSGAKTGLLLWFQTVLPTLLPAMIVSDFLIRIQADRYLNQIFARPFSLLFGIRKSCAYAVLVGFLCGYPIGAKTSASLLLQGRIRRDEASYLLAFCNQPSPMFLIGFLCLSLLKEQGGISLALPILTGVYGSAVFISFLYRILRRLMLFIAAEDPNPVSLKQEPLSSAAPEKNASPLRAASLQKTTNPSPLTLLEHSMMTSFEVMVKIGGYMMLFSILEAFLLRVPMPVPLRSTAMGFVEMTTGSRQIAVSLPRLWAVAFCCGAAAFGGLSGLAQTANVLQDSGLSVRRYLLWKLLQGGLAVIIAILILCFPDGF
jgi:sporulation integral membrane protein YlbJ